MVRNYKRKQIVNPSLYNINGKSNGRNNSSHDDIWGGILLRMIFIIKI